MKRYFHKLVSLVCVALYVLFPEGKIEFLRDSDGVRTKSPIWPNPVDFDPDPRILERRSSDELVFPEMRRKETTDLSNMDWFQPLSEPVRRPDWHVAHYLPAAPSGTTS